MPCLLSSSRRINRYRINKACGFSLLELIVVLVIIGVLVATISISITDTRGDNLHFEARRLAARLSLAVDEAILTNQELGFEVATDGYRFLILNEDKWQVFDSTNEKQFVEQQLPEEMEIQLSVDNLFSQFQQVDNINKLFQEKQESDDNKNEKEQALALRPQVYLMSSGELNPFTLLIGYEDVEPIYYQLAASFDGKIKLDGPFYESMSYALAHTKIHTEGQK